MDNKSFYDYFQHQLNNPVQQSTPRTIAEKLFLGTGHAGILLDDEMKTDDLFCFLIEVTLEGLDLIASEASIFDLDYSYNPIVTMLKQGLEKAFVQMTVETVYFEDVQSMRSDSSYFYLIVPKPNDSLTNDWHILDKYRLIPNPFFKYDDSLQLNQLSVMFNNKNNEPFQITFDLINRPMI